jgi:hypothetical protein
MHPYGSETKNKLHPLTRSRPSRVYLCLYRDNLSSKAMLAGMNRPALPCGASFFSNTERAHTMKRVAVSFLLLLLLALPAAGQQPDTTANQTPSEPTHERNVFFGGTIGVSFGSYFRLSFQPLVGYNFTPKLSGGIKLGYEYIKDSRYEPTVTWNNYGASVFGRFRFIPPAYLHAEFAYANYGAKTAKLEAERVWVPFLYLGAGYYKPISRSTALFVEVLFDVLQDPNSPYDAWQPMISFGVVAGL